MRTMTLMIACFGFLCIVIIQRVLYNPTSRNSSTVVAASKNENNDENALSDSNNIKQEVEVTVDDEISTKNMKNDSTIKTIALLGERNSGSTWLLKELQRCFNDTSLTIRNSLTRHKHYFQFDDGRDDPNSVLVISEFRHPYTWIKGMMAKSRHTPAHRNKTWYEYVTIPWTMEREASDKQYENNTTSVCKGKFKYNEVICCNPEPPKHEYLVKKSSGIIEQETPYYELNVNGSGIPYNNVLEMRYDKIINHIQTVLTFPFVSDVVIVRYEDLIKYGTQDIIVTKIEQATGVKSHCIPTPPQPNRTSRDVEEDFKQWLDLNVNWDIEKLIGYEPL